MLDVEEEDEEEEELDVTIEGAEEDEEEEEISELWDAWDGEPSLSQMSDERRKKAAKRPESLQLLSSSSQVGAAPGPGSAGTTAVCRNQSVGLLSSRSPLGSRGQLICSRRAKSCGRG